MCYCLFMQRDNTMYVIFVFLYRKLRRSQREAAIAARKVCTVNALYFIW